VVLEAKGVDQLDLTCEDCRSVTESPKKGTFGVK